VAASSPFRYVVTLMPVSQFSINGTAGVGSVDYPGTNFGLRSGDSRLYSIGLDFT
jgi:hypothetical protein